MKITVTPGGDQYRYLWLKGITGLNMSQHCASVFYGEYVPEFGHRAEGLKTTVSVELDQHNKPGVMAWYLCGVVTPWNWARNAHLAFVRAEGESWEGPAGEGSRLSVQLEDAAPVFGWGVHSIPDTDRRRNDPAYMTCRNYQFAHHLAGIRGTGTPNREPRHRSTTSRSGFGRLF